jgi:hypothetical protein
LAYKVAGNILSELITIDQSFGFDLGALLAVFKWPQIYIKLGAKARLQLYSGRVY